MSCGPWELRDDAWAKGQSGRLLAFCLLWTPWSRVEQEPGVCSRPRRLELWLPHQEAELSWGEEAVCPDATTGRCSLHPGKCGGGGTMIWEEESPPWIDSR